MCVWFLGSSKLTTGILQHAAAVDELCTAYEDWRFMTSCGGINVSYLSSAIVLVTITTSHPYVSAFNHMIYYL